MQAFLIGHIYLIGILSFLLGAMFMPVVIRIAKAKGFVVRPNKRMVHNGEIPNIGGLNICFCFMIVYLLFAPLTQDQFFLIGLFLIMIVGFIDDVLVLRPAEKLVGESLAGIALIGFADIRITHLFGLFGMGEIGVIPSYIISLLVLLAIINAINLIDGIDGLASGLGILYCIFFTAYFGMSGEALWAGMAVSLIGVLAVFFLYNVFGKSDKIFMGDSGSLLLGYLLTTFVFRFCELNAYHLVPEAMYMSAAPAVAICVLTIPLFDAMRVGITRIRQHRSPFEADKNHIHHLLLRAGLSHIQTTCVLLGISSLFIGLGIVGRNWNIGLLLAVDFGIATLMTIVLWRVINRKKIPSLC